MIRNIIKKIIIILNLVKVNLSVMKSVFVKTDHFMMTIDSLLINSFRSISITFTEMFYKSMIWNIIEKHTKQTDVENY